MEANINQIVDRLLPLLRGFSRGDYGIALGGAHAKAADDAQSDIDLYVFAREILPAAERDGLCARFSADIEGVVSWGEDGPFVQGGTDFYYQQKKIEVWFRNIDYIAGIVAECQAGQAKRDYIAWTVMGFFNYCTLSDLNQMVPLEDPQAILRGWNAQVHTFPPLLRQRIVQEHYYAAQFWPDNFHYKTAVQRCDLLYTTGIVQQVVHHLIQVIFALNQVYFPGEKKLETALAHLYRKPERFVERITALVYPAADASQQALEDQRRELLSLVSETRALLVEQKLLG